MVLTPPLSNLTATRITVPHSARATAITMPVAEELYTGVAAVNILNVTALSMADIAIVKLSMSDVREVLVRFVS